MDDPLSYAKGRATSDVRATITWLEAHDFALAQSRGGRDESFGNVLLHFERPDGLRIEVLRDRSQWTCVISGGENPRSPLNVLITAMSPESEPMLVDRGFGDPLPEQLPEGISWLTTVPAAIAWLLSGDRTAQIEDADQRWRAASRERLGYPE